MKKVGLTKSQQIKTKKITSKVLVLLKIPNKTNMAAVELDLFLIIPLQSKIYQNKLKNKLSFNSVSAVFIGLLT